MVCVSTDPLVSHYSKTLRLIEAMAVSAALKSMPKMPRWVPALPAPTPWDSAQVTAVAEMLAEGARMAAAELRAGAA